MVRQPAYVKWRPWLASAACVLAGIGVVYIFATSPIQWPEVWNYLASPAILDGVVVTIELTCLSMILGIALGIVLALKRTSTIPALSTVSGLYVWFFRGAPLLVQIISCEQTASGRRPRRKGDIFHALPAHHCGLWFDRRALFVRRRRPVPLTIGLRGTRADALQRIATSVWPTTRHAKAQGPLSKNEGRNVVASLE